MNNNRPPLPFFPVPKTGETVFSLVDRCLVRSGINETHLLMELISQRRKTSLQSVLPGYLTRLAERMPDGHSWRDAATIVRAHTGLPYFIYFDCERDRESLLCKLDSPAQSQPLAMALGVTSYRCGASPKHPQYCPTCAVEDDAAIGFSYFRREHQLPGVVVCWRHGTVLAHGCQRCGPYPIKGSAASMAGKCLCCEGITPLSAHIDLPDNMEALHWLACQSAFMVKSAGTRHINIRATLRANALKQGYGRGVLLEPSRLAEAIENRFGREILEWLGCPVLSKGRPTAWIRRILSGQLDGKKRSPSLLFLLIIGTLFESAEAFEATVEMQGEAHRVFVSTPEVETDQASLRPAWSEQLFDLIHESDCGLPGISKKMAVPVYQLIEEIRQRGWRVPLSKHTQKKLGDETIVAIQ